MQIELDYETMAALESALGVAEANDARDAQSWAKLAGSQEMAGEWQTAEKLAAFFQAQAGRYRRALTALQRAKREGPHA